MTSKAIAVALSRPARTTELNQTRREDGRQPFGAGSLIRGPEPDLKMTQRVEECDSRDWPVTLQPNVAVQALCRARTRACRRGSAKGQVAGNRMLAAFIFVFVFGLFRDLAQFWCKRRQLL